MHTGSEPAYLLAAHSDRFTHVQPHAISLDCNPLIFTLCNLPSRLLYTFGENFQESGVAGQQFAAMCSLSLLSYVV